MYRCKQLTYCVYTCLFVLFSCSPQRRLLYLGNQSNTEFTQQFPKSFLQYNFRNMGPSTIFNASLTLLLPFRVSNLQGRYFLYPFNITVSDCGYVT